MPLRRRMPAAALAALLALALAACTPSQPTPSPTPTSAHTPLFTSDAEALKAATDAYAAYLKMSDTISHEGGADPERIKQYATGNAAELVLKSAAQFREAGAHSVGATQFRGVRLQRASDGGREVAIYVCEDVSGVDVLNSSGMSLVKPGRGFLTAFLVTLVAAPRMATLKVKDRETWAPEGICLS